MYWYVFHMYGLHLGALGWRLFSCFRGDHVLRQIQIPAEPPASRRHHQARRCQEERPVCPSEVGIFPQKINCVNPKLLIKRLEKVDYSAVLIYKKT